MENEINIRSISQQCHNPEFGIRGCMVKMESSLDDHGRNSHRTWLASAASTIFVWDLSLISSNVTVSDSFAEIYEVCSKTIGEGDVKFILGSTSFSIRSEHTPNFIENVVAISSILPHFRYIFDKTNTFEEYIIHGHKSGRKGLQQEQISGLYPFPCPFSLHDHAKSAMKPSTALNSKRWYHY